MNTLRLYENLEFFEIFNPVFEFLKCGTWIISADSIRLYEDFVGNVVINEENRNLDYEIKSLGQEKEIKNILMINNDVYNPEYYYGSYGCFSYVDIFPKYNNLLVEDLAEIFFFKDIIEDPFAILKRYSESNCALDFITSNNVYAAFTNHDGSFWDFYSKNPMLHELLINSFKSRSIIFDFGVWGAMERQTDVRIFNANRSKKSL